MKLTNVVNSIVTDPAVLALSDNDMIAVVGSELQKSSLFFNPNNDIIDSMIKRYDNGIVKLSLQFLTNYQADLQSSVSDKIFFAGDYIYSPDLAGAAWAGERAAEAIVAQ